MSDNILPAMQTQGALKKGAPCVLQVLPRLGIGGAERTTLDISRALVQAGWRSLVASAGGPLQEVIEQSGSEHITLPLHSKNPLTVFANALRLQRCLREYGVDLLHARSRMPAWSALMASRRSDVAFVTTYHSTVHGYPAWKRFYNGVMCRSDVVIAKSRYNGERIVAAHSPFPARLEMIVAGIDMEAFSRSRCPAEELRQLRDHWNAGERLVALLPGRLDRNKGHEVFLEALARMSPEERPLGVVLGGSAKASGQAYLDLLHRRAEALGLEGDVVFAGGFPAEQMPLAYAASDMVVTPSVFAEPFGRVAVEAQAMERPVIASDIGGFRETIHTEEASRTGWLVETGNASALAEALRSAVSLSGEARAQLGRHAREHVKARFSMEEMCERTLALYRELLAKRCLSP